LKHWIVQSSEGVGHHYWCFSDFSTKFSKGKKAEFAITDYLYVPYVSPEERSDELEDWFAVDESGLAVLSAAAHFGRPGDVQSEKTLQQAIRAAIALGFRSAYQFYLISEQFNPKDADEPVHLRIVENAYRIFNVKFRQFRNWQFMVLYDLPVDLLISERPFHDWTLRGDQMQIVTMPLAPRALLVGQPPSDPKRREMSIQWHRASDRGKLAVQQNHFSIETARQWIVSCTAEQLHSHASELGRERLEQRRATDRRVLVSVDRQRPEK
jgi:hypothetical protein